MATFFLWEVWSSFSRVLQYFKLYFNINNINIFQHEIEILMTQDNIFKNDNFID